MRSRTEDLAAPQAAFEPATRSSASQKNPQDKLLEQVQSTIGAGATVVLGGDRPDRQGAYFNPTILTDIVPDMPTYDQELFGPVASIMSSKTNPPRSTSPKHLSRN